jgi:16S rRNA processing protein RimM
MSSKSSKTDNPAKRRPDLPETVSVGRVLRPHGVRGEVVVEVFSDVPGRFDPGSSLLMTRPGRPAERVRVAAGRPHKSGALVLFEGWEDRDRVEELRGAVLEVPLEEVPEPPPGVYYEFQLLGCRCRAGGEELGEVVEVLEDGGGLLLVIEGGGRRVPVPFVKSFLREVDVAAGSIELDLPPGLVETCASKS